MASSDRAVGPAGVPDPAPVRTGPTSLCRVRRRLGTGRMTKELVMDLFGFAGEDFVEQVKDVITVGELYDLAAGQIIFT
ncbi:hypothetical protein GCM10028784_02410 [Myceligenerans cantabricum]